MASPGPQRYFLRSTRSPVAHSITYRTFPTPRKWSHIIYSVSSTILVGASEVNNQHYYTTPSCPAEKRPGSAEYLPTFVDLSRTPQYSCRRQCLPTFPDILNFPEHGRSVDHASMNQVVNHIGIPVTAPLQTPSAAQYECDRGFWNNSNPAYSIGLPLPLKPSKSSCQKCK